MQYEVYLDVLFLENMMMDFLILLAVKKVFPCSATYGSLLAGSFTGSLLTCAILFFPCPVWTRYILLFFLVNSCMTVIVYGGRPVQQQTTQVPPLQSARTPQSKVKEQSIKIPDFFKK